MAVIIRVFLKSGPTAIIVMDSIYRIDLFCLEGILLLITFPEFRKYTQVTLLIFVPCGFNLCALQQYNSAA